MEGDGPSRVVPARRGVNTSLLSPCATINRIMDS